MVCECGIARTMKFYSPKSSVICIGKKSSRQNMASGEGQVWGGDVYCLEIKEQKEYL